MADRGSGGRFPQSSGIDLSLPFFNCQWRQLTYIYMQNDQYVKILIQIGELIKEREAWRQVAPVFRIPPQPVFNP
ncbi:MAG: hypothetical protein C4567_07210 [Deltaproteobacteria bacterium]|nr:MAG: hypothetical protein C4567_07210 [Deltaproteobacteria bacterium]